MKNLLISSIFLFMFACATKISQEKFKDSELMDASKNEDILIEEGIIEDSSKASDPSGEGKLIGSILAGAKVTKKNQTALQPKIDSAINSFIKDNDLDITPEELKQERSSAADQLIICAVEDYINNQQRDLQHG